MPRAYYLLEPYLYGLGADPRPGAQRRDRHPRLEPGLEAVYHGPGLRFHEAGTGRGKVREPRYPRDHELHVLF